MDARKNVWERRSQDDDYEVVDDDDIQDRNRNGYSDRRSSSASVFRRSQPSDGDYDGRNGNESILKRLTTGNNRRFRIGPSPEHGEENREHHNREWYNERHQILSKGGEKDGRKNPSEQSQYEEEERKESSSEATKYPQSGASSMPPPHPGHPYPYHPGMPGAYPPPPGHYGHPPYMHPGHHLYPPPAAAPRESSDDRGNDGKKSNARAPTVHRSRKNESGDAQQQSYYPPPPHHPYPPHPYYEGYYDPNFGYPYGHPQYHPGYYPPPNNADATEYSKSEEKDRKNPRAKSQGEGQSSQASRPQQKSSSTTANTDDHPKGEERVDHTPMSNTRTTRRIIGSHTPIHVPRAGSPPPQSQRPPYTDNREGQPKSETCAKNQPPLRNGHDSCDDAQPLPFKQTGNSGSVFRSSSSSDGPRRYNDDGGDESKQRNKISDEVDENTAHEMLLSLSKSYDRDEVENRRMRESRNHDKSGSEERPKSPDEPPRIQHFHKSQSSDTFEVRYAALVFHAPWTYYCQISHMHPLFQIHSHNRVH